VSYVVAVLGHSQFPSAAILNRLEHSDALTTIVRSTPWLCEVLEVVRDVGPLDAYIAAGAVRDTVWNALTRRPSSGPYGDVDVVYWSDAEPEGAAHAQEARLRAHLPRIDWEVTNQATVHLWHRQAHGLHLEPHRNVAEGLATWPETATAVGIRLNVEGALDILAPLGRASAGCSAGPSWSSCSRRQRDR
jgi:hypothetical protein